MSSQTTEGREPKRLVGDEGTSLVEYAFLLTLLALVCIGAVTYFQHNVSASLSKSSSAIVQAGSGP